MRKQYLYLLFFIIFSEKMVAQPSFLSLLGEPNLKDYYIYYNFYNGVQMIEIDNLSYANDKASFLDGIEPVNTTHAWYIDAIPNAYVFRNQSGQIISQFNVGTKKFKAADFISPANLKGKTRSHKLNVPSAKLEPYHAFYEKYKKPDFGDFVFLVWGPNGKYGIIDTLGKLLADTIYDELNYSVRNYYFKLNGKWGLMNADLKVIIQPIYTELKNLRKNIHYAYTDKSGIINSDNNILVDFKYEDIVAAKWFYFYALDSVPDTIIMANGKSYFGKIKKYGIMDLNFNIMTAPIYRNIEQFDEDHYSAYKSSGLGILDNKGNELTSFKYFKEPYSIDSGYYMAEVSVYDSERGRRTYRGFLDSAFKEIGEIKYDNVGFFINGFGAVCIDNKWGFINAKGEQVVDCKYYQVNPMKNGYSIVHVNIAKNESVDGRTDLYGLIDQSGKIVVPPTYHGIDVSKDGTYAFCIYRRIDLPNNKVEWEKECDSFDLKNGTFKKKK